MGATKIDIGTTQDAPIKVKSSTLDIDASQELTIDSATKIDIGTAQDKPIQVKSSTLDIKASDNTGLEMVVTHPGDNNKKLTIKAENKTVGKTAKLDIDADGDLTIDSATKITIGTALPAGKELTLGGVSSEMKFDTKAANDKANDTITITNKEGTGDSAIKLKATEGHIRLSAKTGVGSVWIDSNVNSTSSDTGSLIINGGIGLTGHIHCGQNVQCHSDEKLKKNIANLENALEKINGIRGVEFDWIDESKNGEHKVIGFIAQELEPVLPELVTTGSDGLKT